MGVKQSNPTEFGSEGGKSTDKSDSVKSTGTPSDSKKDLKVVCS